MFAGRLFGKQSWAMTTPTISLVQFWPPRGWNWVELPHILLRSLAIPLESSMQALSWEFFLTKWNAPIVENSAIKVRIVFLLNVYPDWWYEFQAKKNWDSVSVNASQGKMDVVSMESHLSLILQAKSSYDTRSDIGNFGSSLVTFSYNINRGAWLLVFRTTDHMTFVAIDFTTTSPLRRTSIANANGVVSLITGLDLCIYLLFSNYWICYLYHRSCINGCLLVKSL